MAFVALVMQTLAALHLVPMAGSNVSSFGQICTAQGMVSIDGRADLPGNTTYAHHGCCDLCAAGAPLALATNVGAVSPSLYFDVPPAAQQVLPPAMATDGPAPPRGPPLA